MLPKPMFWRKPRGGVNISGFAQETVCYMGQHLVFSDVEEVANNLTGAGFNAKQIERVCHRYGQCLEDRDINNIEVNELLVISGFLLYLVFAVSRKYKLSRKFLIATLLVVMVFSSILILGNQFLEIRIL